jgi:hypothetical protein
MVNMYSTIRRYQKYLVIGAIFSISLLISHPSGQVWAQFYKIPSDPNAINYRSAVFDAMKISFWYPRDWTLTTSPEAYKVSGEGAALEIRAKVPTPGSYFPSFNIPIEQIADGMIGILVSPDIRLISQTPIYIYDIPAYLMSFSVNQLDGKILQADIFLFMIGGKLYEVTYKTHAAPESLHQQNLSIENAMIHAIRLGFYYDLAKWTTGMRPMPDVTTDTNTTYPPPGSDIAKQVYDKHMDDWTKCQYRNSATIHCKGV